jgi:hypothetical protein
MSSRQQVINDPITKLCPEDRLWVRHAMRCIVGWSNVILAATDGQTTMIEATSTLKAISKEAEAVRAVVAGESASPWSSDRVPRDYLKLSDPETYAETKT